MRLSSAAIQWECLLLDGAHPTEEESVRAKMRTYTSYGIGGIVATEGPQNNNVFKLGTSKLWCL